MIPSAPDAAGVLSKMTVPRSRAGIRLDGRERRCAVSHQAPIAEPTTVASNPNVRLVMGLNPSNTDAS
jgi:hypothetical protein